MEWNQRRFDGPHRANGLTMPWSRAALREGRRKTQKTVFLEFMRDPFVNNLLKIKRILSRQYAGT